MNRERLLERFLRYVKVDTTAVPDAGKYPSSPGQSTLGKMLVEELLEMGLTDARQDDHGLITATIPATNGQSTPVVAFNSHLDTSPETTGANVRPQVIRDYQGGDIVLPGDTSQVIRAADNPELNDLQGATLVTTDGTTLLGGDDKAGVAVIMETAAYLAEHTDIQHGPVKVLFTCDEEIGHGVDYVDLKRLNADVCYTLDGGGANEIDVETFSADHAVVTVHGVNIHPSIAKGRMINAVRAAAEFVARLPRDRMSPETTSDREGFLHPYDVTGGVAKVSMKILLRDFDTAALAEQADFLRKTASDVERAFPGVRVEVNVQRQYRNLADGLKREPRAVALAQEAHRRLGREAKLTIVRGGTDGSQLTEKGLPTPNLSTGQHNPHSPLEWTCSDEMVAAAEVLVQLVQLWSESD